MRGCFLGFPFCAHLSAEVLFSRCCLSFKKTRFWFCPFTLVAIAFFAPYLYAVVLRKKDSSFGFAPLEHLKVRSYFLAAVCRFKGLNGLLLLAD